MVGKSIAELSALAGEGGGGKASSRASKLTELKKRQADIKRKNEQLMGEMIRKEEGSVSSARENDKDRIFIKLYEHILRNPSQCFPL